MLCGDGVGMVVKYMGMGWGWKRNHGDGVGMGLIFNTVSLFSYHMGTAIKHPVLDRVKLLSVIFDIQAL